MLFPFFISCYFIFFPNECPGLWRHSPDPGHSLWEEKKVARNEKRKKQLWVFVYIKYGKFWSILLELFVEHKLWNWEECITLLAEMKSTSNNYPKRTIKARGSSETKKYLGHLWEGPSSKVFVKIFVCLFTYWPKWKLKKYFYWTRTAFRETYWFLHLHFGQ